ncbi:MAG: hypothetical protein ACYDHY_01065 [Acidiferrobacterales bacterium]
MAQHATPSAARVPAPEQVDSQPAGFDKFEQFMATQAQAHAHTATSKESPFHRLVEKAIVGFIGGVVISLPFALVGLIKNLRAIKKQRGHLVSYRARLAVTGGLLWFMLVTFISYAIEPNWTGGRFYTILFAPPAMMSISILLWNWVRKVKPTQ